MGIGTRRTILASAALALLLGGTGLAGAETVFDDFGPAGTYDTSGGATLGFPLDSVVGDAFTTPGDRIFALDTITLAAGLVRGPNLLDVRLMSDAGGAPATTIESFHFDGAMGQFGQANLPLVATSALHPLLAPGTQFWLIASAPGGDQGEWAVWDWNSIGDAGPQALSVNGGPYQVSNQISGASRVEGTPVSVPEPGTLVMGSLAALIGIGAWPRRRGAPPRPTSPVRRPSCTATSDAHGHRLEVARSRDPEQ